MLEKLGFGPLSAVNTVCCAKMGKDTLMFDELRIIK